MSGHLYGGFGAKARWFVKRFGWGELFLLPLRILLSRVVIPFLHRRRFTFQGRDLEYFYAHYNVTWCNERCIEVPIGRDYLERFAGREVLEVGNVLSHYGTCRHSVLDKYERGPAILNADIIDHRPTHPPDLILSLSTFEHIGFDDDTGGSSGEKIQAAVSACRGLLAPCGLLAFTVPLGYNPELDRLIEQDALGQDRGWFLLRRDAREWEEVARGVAIGTSYGRPYPFANALFVAEYDAPG